MIPRRYAPLLFGFLLSGLMSLLVSGISTYRAATSAGQFIDLWIGAWLTAWLVALPAVLVAAPVVKRVVERVTVKPGAP